MDYTKLLLGGLTLLIGYVGFYLSKKADLMKEIPLYIKRAEEIYIDYTKAGSEKFESVVDGIYSIVPVFLKILITREIIGIWVEAIFKSIESYADLQIDKIIKEDVKEKE